MSKVAQIKSVDRKNITIHIKGSSKIFYLNLDELKQLRKDIDEKIKEVESKKEVDEYFNKIGELLGIEDSNDLIDKLEEMYGD